MGIGKVDVSYWVERHTDILCSGYLGVVPLGFMAATITPCVRFASVLVTHKYIFRQRSACLAPHLSWLSSLIQRYYEEFDQSWHMILTVQPTKNELVSILFISVP